MSSSNLFCHNCGTQVEPGYIYCPNCATPLNNKGTNGANMHSAPTPGSDIHTHVELTLEEAVFGSIKSINLDLIDDCPVCHGSGRQGIGTCPKCYGVGYIKTLKKIEIKVPAGIDNGQFIRLHDMGNLGTNGGKRGDLLVAVLVKNHPYFIRNGNDLYTVQVVSVDQLMPNKILNINTLDGAYPYKTTDITDAKSKIKIRGRGVPNLKDNNIRGDLYVSFILDDKI